MNPDEPQDRRKEANNTLQPKKQKHHAEGDENIPFHKYKTIVQMRKDYKKLDAIFDDYEGYKRRRAFHVVLVSVILVVIFIQVCFSVRIYRAFENKIIFDLQDFLNINKSPMKFLSDVTYVDSEHINTLILIMCFTFMYGYDYMIGMGILVKYLLGMTVFKFLSVAMQEPRPFWLGLLTPERTINNDIVGYRCDNTFAMPELTITQLFWFIINFQDILKKSQIKIKMIIDKVFLMGSVLIMLFAIVIKYIGGQIFILQVIMSLLLAVILLQVSKYLTIYIRKAIERSTVGASLEKKYILNYYIGLMLIAIADLIIVITNSSYNHTQLKYLENLVLSILIQIDCKIFHGLDSDIEKLDPVKSIGKRVLIQASTLPSCDLRSLPTCLELLSEQLGHLVIQTAL